MRCKVNLIDIYDIRDKNIRVNIRDKNIRVNIRDKNIRVNIRDKNIRVNIKMLFLGLEYIYCRA